MEIGKERSDVIVALRANCQACGSVDGGLQTVQVAAGQAGESAVALVQFDMTKLEMSVDSVDSGTDRLILRICRRMQKHVHTSLVTCDLIDMLLSRYTPRSRTEAAGVTLSLIHI